MKRTTIMLPDDLKIRAHHRAKSIGVSLGEFVRESLETVLRQREDEKPTEDSLFVDNAVYEGKAPRDLSKNHDRYLYGEK